MRIKTKQTLVFVAALLVLVTSCSDRKRKQICERAVVRIHDQFNAGHYHDIYAQADKCSDGSKADPLVWFGTEHRELGTAKVANVTERHASVLMLVQL